MEITREIFDQQRRPRFGGANPERMRFAFWEWMIRSNEVETPAEGDSIIPGQIIREGELKSRYGPYKVRDFFKLPMNPDDGPIWTFERYGATCSKLPDGRIIYIGGEHEDSYDPDFFIYNDVIVFDSTDQIEIYGYPKDVFPPTDFHTASVVGDQIFIVGCLGYSEARNPGHTAVYALNLSDYRISEIRTSGEMPGWIFEHEADFDSEVITLRGGKVVEQHGGEHRYRRNFEDYALDIKSLVWHRLTSRNWRQFSIYQEDGSLFVLERDPRRKALLPRTIEHTVVPCDEGIRMMVAGVPVSVTIEIERIDICVEGELSNEISVRLVEEIRANTEAAIKHRCVLEQM